MKIRTSRLHGFNRFPNGDVEGTMMVQMRDGKCYRVETGSTAIKGFAKLHCCCRVSGLT